MHKTGYLAWTLSAKLHLGEIARDSFAEKNIANVEVLTTPTRFNSLLWRILAVNEMHHYESFYTVLDKALLSNSRNIHIH